MRRCWRSWTARSWQGWWKLTFFGAMLCHALQCYWRVVRFLMQMGSGQSLSFCLTGSPSDVCFEKQIRRTNATHSGSMVIRQDGAAKAGPRWNMVEQVKWPTALVTHVKNHTGLNHARAVGWGKGVKLWNTQPIYLTIAFMIIHDCAYRMVLSALTVECISALPQIPSILVCFVLYLLSHV